MAENGNGKTAEWVMWILGIFVLIAMSVSGYAVNKADNAVQKEDYRIDQSRLERTVGDIACDVKKILERLPK